MSYINRAFIVIFFLCASGTASPQSTKSTVVDDAHSLKIKENIILRLKRARPDLEFSDIEASPLSGVYEVKVNGQLAFVGENGDYLISGEMFKINPDGLVNLQELERKKVEIAFEPERAKLMNAVERETMVVFTPSGEIKSYVNVFSDIDCPFCRRMHGEIDKYLDKGIEVRYLAFPIGGLSSNSAKKLATTWCSSDPQVLMTRYKRGENIPVVDCDASIISDHYELGRKVGVTGTPAIVLPSGKLIPGVVTPEILAQELGI